MQPVGHITRSEWKRVIVLASSVMLVTLVPYLVGAMVSTPDWQFGGLLTGLEDQYSYLAKMIQGARGAWLFHLPYTATPHPGVFLYIFYLLLGKLALVFGLSPVVMYHLARVVLGGVTILVTYRFMAEFVASSAIRFVALGLIVMAGGPGWIALLTGQPTLMNSLPLEFILPEGFTFLLLYTLPHLLLSRTCLLLGAINIWQAGQSGSARQVVTASVCWLVMSIIQPIHAAVAVAMVVMMTLARSLAMRRIAWRQAVTGAIAGSFALPMVIYVYLFGGDPTYGPWASTLITSPEPLLYAVTYGLPLVLAIGGLIYTLRRRKVGLWLLALWMGAGPFMLYAPTNAQRRLIEGWQIPLSVMTALGLVRYGLPWLRRVGRQLAARRSRQVRRWSRQAIVIVVALTTPTYLLMVGYHISAVLTHWPPLFHDAGLVGATDWLEQHATYADGVLAAYNTSTVIPARAAVRVMTGHRSETIDSETRTAEVRQFFQADTPDSWRQALLTRLQLTYVYVGFEERQLGSFDPSCADYLTPVFTANDSILYRVIAP